MGETSNIQGFWQNDSVLWTNPDLHPVISDAELIQRIRKFSSSVVNLLQPGQKLDLGAGSGTNYYLGELSAAEFIHLDISPETLEGMKSKKNVIANADFTLPFLSDSFTFVSSFFLMRYLSNQGNFINEVARITKSGARILILDYEYLNHPMAKSIFDTDLISRYMRADFTEVFGTTLIPQTTQRLGNIVNIRGPVNVITGIRK